MLEYISPAAGEDPSEPSINTTSVVAPLPIYIKNKFLGSFIITLHVIAHVVRPLGWVVLIVNTNQMA